MDAVDVVLLAGAALVAGAINAVAGGGTLVSFPAAIAAGLSPLVANATNTVALTPASLAAAWAYRREIRKDAEVVKALLAPAGAGGLVGSGLLLVTPQRVFETAVPFLVLLATLLLFWQNVRGSKAPAEGRAQGAGEAWGLPRSRGLVLLLEFLVGVYGGYFGAGIGIMMLALFSMLGGGRHIHRMNAVKTVLGGVINGIAAIAFVVTRAVDPRAAAIMTLGAVVGGFGGAALGRRVDPRVIRWVVVAIGLVLSATLGWRRLRS